MKRIILLVLLAFAVLLLGCPNPPQPPVSDLPEDFELDYGNGAMHLDWGWYELTVDSEGKAVFTKGMGSAMEKSEEFTASEKEMLDIYNTARENGFFGLQDTYKDPSIMDGGWAEISIKADGSSKTVRMLNYSLQAFNAVEAEINKVIHAHLGEDAYSLSDLRDECSEKEKECLGNFEDFECDEWRNYCEWKEDLEEFSPMYCDKLENRVKCIDYCTDNICEEELCEVLVFDAPKCTECWAGCCSQCNDLDSCGAGIGCVISWLHPAGESWQFGGCENMDFCQTNEQVCNYVFTSYQGYYYHSFIEEDSEKAIEYELVGDALLELYTEECEGE